MPYASLKLNSLFDVNVTGPLVYDGLKLASPVKGKPYSVSPLVAALKVAWLVYVTVAAEALPPTNEVAARAAVASIL